MRRLREGKKSVSQRSLAAVVELAASSPVPLIMSQYSSCQKSSVLLVVQHKPVREGWAYTRLG